MEGYATETEKAPGVRIEELRLRSCRWPLGGRWEHVEFYCGELTVPGCPYCKEHRQQAFVRAERPGVKRTPMPFLILKDRRR